MTNYYVYYRVDEGSVESLRPRIERLFEQVQETSGVRGKWLRRRDDPQTYMEVYEGVRDTGAFEQILQRESAALGLARKTETFVDVPDPARVAR